MNENITESANKNVPTKNSKKKWNKRTIVMFFLSLGVAAYLLFGEQEMVVTKQDKSVLITADHLVDWTNNFKPNPDKEVFSKIKMFYIIDSTYELKYTYFDKDISLDYQIVKELTPGEAALAYEAFKLGISFADDSLIYKEDNSFFQYGNNSQFYFVQTNLVIVEIYFYRE